MGMALCGKSTRRTGLCVHALAPWGLGLVFFDDPIITAVGMVDELWMMYVAVIVTVIIMLIASKPIASFISRHPSFKILALSFLMVIGVALIAEGAGHPIPQGFIYCSMAFAFLVDVLQLRILGRKKSGA